MKLLWVLIVWALIALPIGVGLVMAVKGSLWLLLVSLLAFFVAFARFGCLHHE